MKIDDLTGKLILKQHLGEGKYGDKDVKASITNHSLILGLDGKQYGVSWNEIILSCIKEITSKKR